MFLQIVLKTRSIGRGNPIKIQARNVPLSFLTSSWKKLFFMHNRMICFSEWVEFSPFEYGIAKYGVFGKTEEFGGKFYKGSLVKKYEEPPLHFLQGTLYS